MRPNLTRFTLALVASVTMVLGAAGTARAQSAPLPLQITNLDVTQYPQVSAVVTVPPDMIGSQPAPLQISVTENGAPRPATAVPVGNEGRQVVLAIDTSGSMAGSPLAAAKAAATGFVNRMPADVPIGIIGFSRSPLVASPVTLDRRATQAAIGRLQAGGETALYDAVSLAARQFGADSGQKDIVVLSDGGDTVSSAKLTDVTQQLQASRVHLDAVELITPDTDANVLTSLTTAGNGQVAPAQSPSALNAVYQSIATDLVDQYRLTYTSVHHGNAGLRITASGGGKVAAGDTTVQLPSVALAVPKPVVRPHAAKPPAQPAATHAAGSRSFLASSTGLELGAFAIFAALVLTFSLALAPRRRARLARLGKSARRGDRATTVTELANRATMVAEKVLDQRGHRGSLNEAIERAGLALRPGEFVVLSACATLVGLAVTALFVNPLLGIAVAGLVAIACRASLTALADRRRARFSEQLGDTLQLLSGSLRAGYGLLQAVDSVAVEAESPTREEFRRIVVETRLGRDLAESLHAASDRVRCDDFDWTIQAIDIHRQVGGDLAKVLDNVANTIRERNQLRRHVRALTAEGRISAYILVALPFLLAFALHLINPSYFALLTKGVGLVLSIAGLVLIGLGGLWLRKLCRLQF